MAMNRSVESVRDAVRDAASTQSQRRVINRAADGVVNKQTATETAANTTMKDVHRKISCKRKLVSSNRVRGVTEVTEVSGVRERAIDPLADTIVIASLINCPLIDFLPSLARFYGMEQTGQDRTGPNRTEPNRTPFIAMQLLENIKA